MTKKQASKIISDLAYQDHTGDPDCDSYRIYEDGELAIVEWRSAAGQAGDLDTVLAIDALGPMASKGYKQARIKLIPCLLDV